MAEECRIRVLEEDVATKIAAGEVVERPASVVKELAENAVDAGATRLAVEVEDGGKALIRVADNGCGMTAQEAVLALQRHATSKIARAEDLTAVRTLGFRGEALPSVASVSRLTIVTRRRGEIEGVRVRAEGGEIQELEPTGGAEGTVITVRDLFYNTPARLKFLKTTRSELGQICDVLTRIALSHPGISVRLASEGDEILHAPGSVDPLNTVTALYGKDLARELVPVTYSRPGIAVEGYVSRPTYTRPTRSGQHFFVNGRWIRNRTLTHAVDEAYRSTMHPGRYPFVVLHVDIDPALVDVNVHPAKTEVRFLREWEVHRAVHEAVKQATQGAGGTEALARQHALSQEDLHGGSWLPPAAASGAGAPVAAAPDAALPDPSDPFAGPDAGAMPGTGTFSPSAGGTAPWTGSPAPALPFGGDDPVHPGAGPSMPPPGAQPSLPDLQAPAPRLRPIAQVWNSYIVAEGPGGLQVIDQHLAHERILFDRLQAAGDATAAAQRLAVPVTLQLTQTEALAVEELLPDLARYGFELEAFGRGAYIVRAVPAFVATGAELSMLRQMLDGMADARVAGASGARLPSAERLAATTACKAAIKKGARLAPEEIRRLLEDLHATSNPYTCPHGCPISVEISYHELLKRFKRI